MLLLLLARIECSIRVHIHKSVLQEGGYCIIVHVGPTLTAALACDLVSNKPTRRLFVVLRRRQGAVGGSTNLRWYLHIKHWITLHRQVRTKKRELPLSACVSQLSHCLVLSR